MTTTHPQRYHGIIKLQLFEYWHTSAGFGKGRYFDAVVTRSEEGLPLLRGKTLRGLLREAIFHAESFGQLAPGTSEAMFGTSQETLQAQEKPEVNRFTTRPGCFRVGSATLPPEWQRYAATQEGKALIKGLYGALSSTAIDEDGLAKEQTLRRIEVAVPLTLQARWEGESFSLAQTTYLPQDALHKALPLLRKLGTSRHRGLGRVRATLLETGANS